MVSQKKSIYVVFSFTIFLALHSAATAIGGYGDQSKISLKLNLRSKKTDKVPVYRPSDFLEERIDDGETPHAVKRRLSNDDKSQSRNSYEAVQDASRLDDSAQNRGDDQSQQSPVSASANTSEAASQLESSSSNNSPNQPTIATNGGSNADTFLPVPQPIPAVEGNTEANPSTQLSDPDVYENSNVGLPADLVPSNADDQSDVEHQVIPPAPDAVHQSNGHDAANPSVIAPSLVPFDVTPYNPTETTAAPPTTDPEKNNDDTETTVAPLTTNVETNDNDTATTDAPLTTNPEKIDDMSTTAVLPTLTPAANHNMDATATPSVFNYGNEIKPDEEKNSQISGLNTTTSIDESSSMPDATKISTIQPVTTTVASSAFVLKIPVIFILSLLFLF